MRALVFWRPPAKRWAAAAVLGCMLWGQTAAGEEPASEAASAPERAPAEAEAPASSEAPSARAETKVTDEPGDAAGEPEASPQDKGSPGLWGRPVRRGGFHFQVGFGVGGGSDTSGIFHTMELGWTFGPYTVAMLHTFIQNKDQFGGTKGGPDLIGGWMAEFKAPLFFPDLVGKVAIGLGGTHEQPDGGDLIVHAGFGASYGVDLHFPIWPRFGPTLTLAALHATAQGQHHFGVGTALGVTLF